MGKRRSDFDRDEVVRTLDSMPSRFVLSVEPTGTDDRQKRLARRHLVIEACFKVDPEEIHEQIFVAKCLRHPVVQPTAGLGRTFSTVIDENFTAHGPGHPWKPNSIAGLVKSIGSGAVLYDESRTDLRRSAAAAKMAKRPELLSCDGLGRRDYGGVVAKTTR